ncbi:hypothetical protein AX15_000476 [Amanita polypyramis BW_CC]|nr:hypothetical protein AX15_000476 [Amanita polypyramis BW_CC]
MLTEGSQCKTSSDETIEKIRASTVIDFICDMSVFGTGMPRLVAQLPPNNENAACAFYFEWKSHYACPTSEGSTWGFFTTIAVLALILVMTYTILGTLYNRYILQLRGFDQIPQFSLESMRYHAHEAIDWFRDIMTILYENSQRRGSDDGLPFRRPGGSPNVPNPFSHFTQSNDGSEFVRPQANRTESIRRHDINPVSHQNQVQSVTQTSSEPQSSSAPPPAQKDAQKFDKDMVQNSTPEEKQQFMLDEEEEEDTGQEMGVIGTSSSQSPRAAMESQARHNSP